MRNPFSRNNTKSDDDSEDRRRRKTYVHQNLTPVSRKEEGEKRYRETQERIRQRAAEERRQRANDIPKHPKGH